MEVKLEEKTVDSLKVGNRINVADKAYLEDAQELVEDNNAKQEKDIDKNYKHEVEDLKNEIKTYVNNYLAIEEKDNSECTYGELIKSSSEGSYLLAPLEDKKMMINGFIDRLKLYKKGDTRIAVIIDYKTNKISGAYNAEYFKRKYSDQLMIYGKAVKELLQADEIILKLYLLQTGEVVSIEYDESKVTKLMKTMDEGFYKISTEAKLAGYEKATSELCGWCKYREWCL